MKRGFLVVTSLLLTLLPLHFTAVAATPTVSIANIVPNKVTVRPAGVLKVTWNFSSENLTMDEAKRMEVTLTPASGIACQPRCPTGAPNLLSGSLSGGLWYAYIDIPGNVMETDYEVNVAMPGFYTKESSAKSPTAVTIVNDAEATDLVSVTPTISGNGWAPSIGPVTRFKGGFKFKILNFNTNNYTWSYYLDKIFNRSYNFIKFYVSPIARSTISNSVCNYQTDKEWFYILYPQSRECS